MEKKISKKTQKPAQAPKKVAQKTEVVKLNPQAKSKPAPKPKAQVAAFGLHNLVVPKGAHKPKKLLGRGPGSGHGKTSTRGSKGQTSRAGRDMYAGFEGGQTPLIRRIPKRGFSGPPKKEFQIVNLDNLNRIKDGLVTPEILEQKGLIKDKFKPVKILGDGELKHPLEIKAHAFSKQASKKITQAGGKIELLNDSIAQ